MIEFLGRTVGYQFLDDVAIADVAFKAWGKTPEELFEEAANATMNVMIGNLRAVAQREKKHIHINAPAMDLLLFNFLQELIYYKDAEVLILAKFDIDIRNRDGQFELECTAFGEGLDPERHDQVVDVKAVTLHRFEVVQDSQGWTAFVILDI